MASGYVIRSYALRRFVCGGGGDNIWINSFIIIIIKCQYSAYAPVCREKACLSCCFRTFDIGVLWECCVVQYAGSSPIKPGLLYGIRALGDGRPDDTPRGYSLSTVEYGAPVEYLLKPESLMKPGETLCFIVGYVSTECRDACKMGCFYIPLKIRPGPIQSSIVRVYEPRNTGGTAPGTWNQPETECLQPQPHLEGDVWLHRSGRNTRVHSSPGGCFQ